MIRPLLRRSRHLRGQTLIIALLILGVLLILSAVFTGILSRAISGASVASGRASISEFSEAGIRYAHKQLLTSELGADWTGNPTPLGTGDVSRDPDIYYLRPPATNEAGNVTYINPDTGKTDRGGPDGLGAYFRVNFENGRALIRVRYGPGDPTVFSGPDATNNGRVGSLLVPGKARNFLILESVGRLGVYNPSDPTSGTRLAVRYRDFADNNDFAQKLALLREFDTKERTSRKLIAFAQIGLIDTARFITNKDRVARPADIGAPAGLGLNFPTGGSAVNIPTYLGGQTRLLNRAPGGGTIPTLQPQPGLGSLYSNADLRVNGSVTASLIPDLGDNWSVAGSITGNPVLNQTRWNGTNWVAGPALTPLADVGRKAPPTILGNNGEPSRYITATRDSGVVGDGGNSGIYGHGEGVYVNNAADYQISPTASGRDAAGTAQSLVQDWLSPRGESNVFRSGWKGSFYIPVGASVRLQADGFTITRGGNPNAPAEERTWREINGTDAGIVSIRYRVGLGTDGLPHVLNTLTAPLVGATINGAITTAQYQQGPRFNGVLYFEGNVRVRGIIPTDVQMTMVSNHTAYIEGSILKGTVGNDVTRAYPTAAFSPGTRLTRRSRSQLMIMAREYVTLNPTMFFGLTNQTRADAEQNGSGAGGINPLRVASPDGELSLQSEMVLNQVNDDPSTWRPLALDYASVSAGSLLPTKLLVSHALEYTDAGPTVTFVTLGINADQFNTPDYNFEVANSPTNAARAQYASINAPAPPPDFGPIYGVDTSDRYQTVAFPVLEQGNVVYNGVTGRLLATPGNGVDRGTYTLDALDSNAFRIKTSALGNDPVGSYLLGRAALVPNDIRIEASIYAEEGSFFVIPGDWFNPNPNDNRAQWVADGANAAASEKRRENFGAAPDAPFYGEPLDVKIEVVGSVSENMPPSAAVQGEWLKKWGWIPRSQTPGTDIPTTHLGPVVDDNYAPNLLVSYDPTLATGRVAGFAADNLSSDADRFGNNAPIRYRIVNGVNVMLPPMPRLPVSPTLAYFGEWK